MRYLHTMLRVRNLDAALKFYGDALGLKEVRRIDNDKAKFTLVFLCAADDQALLAQTKGRGAPLVELTYNWDEETYGEDRYFGHLAYEVDDIYATCDRLMKLGITINRPPRDGQMAFVPLSRSAFDRTAAKGRCAAAAGAVDLNAQHRPLVVQSPFEKLSGAGIRKWNRCAVFAFLKPILVYMEATTMGRGLLLWLLGVPIPVIILLWLFFGR